MRWTYENDEEGLAGREFDNWLIRDEETDNRDVIAVIPKTGDEDYDNSVTFPRVQLIASLPKMQQDLKEAAQYLAMLRDSVFEDSDWLTVEDIIEEYAG